MSCIGRKDPEAETTKAVVICLLSLRPLTETFFYSFDEKVHLPWQA